MALRHFSTVPFFCISRCQWKCISLLSRFSNCHNYAIPKSFIKICFWFSSFKRHFLCKHTLVMLSICLVLIFVMRTRLLPKSRVSITISVVASLVKSKHGSPWTSLILFILSSPFFCIVRLLIYYRLLTLYAFILSIIYTFFLYSYFSQWLSYSERLKETVNLVIQNKPFWTLNRNICVANKQKNVLFILIFHDLTEFYF